MRRRLCWAVPLAILLALASLIVAPQKGNADGDGQQGGTPENPPPPVVGEPDVPIGPGPCAVIPAPLAVQLVAKTGRLDLLLAFISAEVQTRAVRAQQLPTRRART